MWQDRRPAAGGGRPQGDRPSWQDRRPSGGPERPQRGGRPGRSDRPQRTDRPSGDRPSWQDRRPSGAERGAPADRRPAGPPLPEWADPRELDASVRSSLRGLDPRNAETVGRHLVAAGGLLEDDPETALAHARAARERASRIAAVREAVGVAAYHAGDYAEAARELRAYRRMSGDESYRAVLADCERALGRPDAALRLVTEALGARPDAEETVELRLVEAGARRDLGELPAALLVLEAALGGRPTPQALGRADLGRLRLATAYADALAAGGDQELADEWFAAVMAADPDDRTGVAERFSGVDFDEDDADDEGDDDDARDAEEPAGGSYLGGLAGDGLDEDTDVGPGYDSSEDDIEAEVAELLGETAGEPEPTPEPHPAPAAPPAAVEHDHARLFQAPPGADRDPSED